ncbi:UDP-N-acetylmuramoyl-L-alanyl-D-glutamate--2,6-diaminopimelate ligase [Streptosporangium amethystogenes subsp. fukuiense]|uniref:UDP-N-acetylmuramoyl-L-alanyl-D-glutamate--2,6-diaminopimelate ligase n=1 Tax=Streptosporangium amethystogenes subsp. fukuiense TaxID=698418 RepID=A0ABW2TCM3_9ACTN
MKLSDLLAGYDHHVLQGDPELADVKTGVAYDSRRMTPGSMYIALQGARTDGHRFVRDAVERGATAVLIDRPIDDGLPPQVCVVQVADTRTAAPVVASRYFGEPAREMDVVAVTGTNGKTSVSYMMEAVLRTGLRARAGVIGTDGYRVGHEPIRMERTTPTTPESVDLHRVLRCMRDQGADTVIMEASSMALMLHRVDHADIDVGVFTNLTPDHLDDHGSMEQYKAAKLRLFSMCRRAVVNADDPVSTDIAALMPGAVTTFGIDSATADFRATNLVVESTGTRFVLHHGERQRHAQMPVPGRFAVANALATVAVCHLLGHDHDIVVDALASLPPIPGRFETFQTSENVSVVVDYAHSPDALQKVLATIREFAGRRVITVFGCGGDRDRTKRAPMGKIAGKHSDVVVVTNDNPRSEDPETIMDQIITAVAATGTQYERITDRGAAIEWALTVAEPGDIVLIAGKGAEKYQIIGERTIRFDDMETVRRLAAGPPTS